MNDDRHCDLLVHNAYVISVDAERRVFSPGAVAVRGKRVAAVGPEREVIEGLGLRAARTIDARGAVVHPGFIDAHNHMVGAGCRGIFANEAFDPTSGVYLEILADSPEERREPVILPSPTGLPAASSTSRASSVVRGEALY